MSDLFQALFEPKRIALVGASGDVTRTTSRPQRFLRKHGFVGEILPVNPGRSEILGDRACKDLESIPGGKARPPCNPWQPAASVA